MRNATNTIGFRVKKRRKELHMTQVELAAKLGITQGTLSQIETGYIKRPTNTKDLADALDCTETYLWFGVDEIHGLDPSNANMALRLAALGDEQRNHILAMIDAFEKSSG
jgi:transcriptional regulator with XRE-family HTH domain